MFLRFSIRNLLRQPTRTLSILATISFGVCSLVIFESFNEGNISLYRENIVRSQYGNGQIMTNGYFNNQYDKPHEHWIEEPTEIIQNVEAKDYVIGAYPRINFQALLSSGEKTMSGIGQGVDAEKESSFFDRMNVIEGTLMKAELDGIMLGEGLAKALNIGVGQSVTVLTNTVFGSMNGSDLTVVGIFKTGRKDFDDHFFRVQIGMAQSLLDTQKVESVAIALKDWRDWDRLKAEVEANYPNLEALSLSVLDKVYFQHAIDFLESQFAVILTIIMSIVILGILNIINSNVFERKFEIGNLVVNGFGTKDVMRLLLLEGAAMGLVGSLVGLILAFFIQLVVVPNGIKMPPTPGITLQVNIPLVITTAMVTKHVVIGCLTAIIATLVAAIRVLRVPLPELLRSI